MRAGRVCALAIGLFTSATLSACVFPTERDASVHVSIKPIHILFQGKDTVAAAQAWQIVSAKDSQPISNVVFVWSSSNASVATVDNTGRIVGVNSGTVIITAAAANFDKAARVATDTVRVSAPLAIDSVGPDTVKYGQVLTIYGVGVDSILSAKLASADLIPVPFSDTVFAGGTARTRFWVPPPATSDSVFFLGIFNGNGSFGYVHGSTTDVIERDIYDPNDTNPHLLSLSGPGPFPGTVLSSLLFYNPALSFETLKRGQTAGADWYRFSQTTTRDVTFILESPGLGGTYATFLSDSLGWKGSTKKYILGHNAWTFGPGSHDCHGLAFTPTEAPADSTIVAFKGLAAGSMDLITIFTQPGRYGLAVIDGYVSELPADKHEDDNSCNAADLRGTDTLPLRDTLAIENPHDIDWIRFYVPSSGLLTPSVQVRVHAFPGATPDSLEDLDLYVIQVPAPSDTALKVVLADTAVGTEHDQTVSLAAGDYYAVVLDFAGASTLYEICAGTVPVLGASVCAGGFPAPPVAASRVAGAAPLSSADVVAGRGAPRAHWRPNPRRPQGRRRLAPGLLPVP